MNNAPEVSEILMKLICGQSSDGRPDLVVVVSKNLHFDFLSSLLPDAEFTEESPTGGGRQLITFLTGVIIPRETLNLWDAAINFHPASPDFPGRDPHHWALYFEARSFGAVVHVIAPEVDRG